ncbi:hypothetical protein BDQ17DRAFT_1395802 [Cyathus striatus]|nr:hypothetical protein BDQ17DRAFT_1395802 [Cyathus striatus]
MIEMITTLPTEILLKILEKLDFFSLIVCKCVCHLLQNIIENTANLQYIIELAVSGSEDGESSNNNLSIAERLQLLKKYQNAWDTELWHDEIKISMQRGGLWELYGNILAQNSTRGDLSFVQLPSKLRSIKQQQWVYSQETFKFNIRDFTVDASQDLIALIETPDTHIQNDHSVLQIHLRTLSTGATHPLAPTCGIVCHTLENSSRQASYSILISRDHIGILINGNLNCENELVILCWKSGELKLNIVGNKVRCFVFMSSTQILASVLETSDEGYILEPTLHIIDFERESKEVRRIGDVENKFVFRYPELDIDAIVHDMSLRSDPAPLWTSGSKLGVPFQIARNNRIYVTSFWVEVSERMQLFVHFVPHDTLQACIDNILSGEMNDAVDWEHWGPESTRMVKSPSYHSRVYVCYVNGSRYVLPQSTAYRGVKPNSPVQWKCSILLYDFNQLAFRRALLDTQQKKEKGKDRSHVPEDGETCFMTEEEVLEGGQLFKEELRTRLPYRVRSIPVSIKRQDGWSALCSEDGILIVDTEIRSNSYRLLAF